MKKKFKLLFASLGILSSVGIVTSCSTTWSHWNPKHNGSGSYEFSHVKAAPYQYKVRDKKDLLDAAWKESSPQTPWDGTLNLSALNNQYELYTIIGYITNIKQVGMNRIDSYWDIGSVVKSEQWKGLRDYIGNLYDLSTINIEESGKSYGNVSINLASTKVALLNGFVNYNNSDIDTSKGINPNTGEQFHNQRAYDVAFAGLLPNGTPVDAGPIAANKFVMPLMQNKSVLALLNIDGNFALSLSKLANIPKDAFIGFTSFMDKINKMFDEFINNFGFKNWIKNNNINFAITSDGKIRNNTPVLSESFKGNIIVIMLK